MPSILKRNLTILLILFGSISLANAPSSAAQQATITPPASTWTWVQDSPVVFCGQMGSISSCTIGAAQIAPTQAGSVWVVSTSTPNNVTVTSVTGGGGQWFPCPNCHISNPSGYTVNAWYNLTGNAGTTQNITINLSGTSGAFFNIDFFEILPPVGATASLDDSGSTIGSNCTVCTEPALNVTATDMILYNPGGKAAQADWKAYSSPVITDVNGGGFNLNTTSGAAPTMNLAVANNPSMWAMAFKSTAGIFTPPSYQNQNSIVQFFSPPGNNAPTCNPTCTLNLPQPTGAGHLLFVMAANLNNDHITSVSGGGTWIVPTGANTCQANWSLVQASGAAFSCAYVLSSTAGVSSINVTLNGTSSTGFGIWEIASSTGSPWVFDTQGSHINSSLPNFSPPGQALTTQGTNDVIFQGGFVPGGASSGGSFYPQTYILHQGTGYILFNEASEAVLLNSGPAAPTPIWVNPQGNGQNTGVIGIAFTAAGVSTAPSPPTGLTAIVH